MFCVSNFQEQASDSKDDLQQSENHSPVSIVMATSEEHQQGQQSHVPQQQGESQQQHLDQQEDQGGVEISQAEEVLLYDV